MRERERARRGEKVRLAKKSAFHEFPRVVSKARHLFSDEKKTVLSHARLPQEKKKKGLSWPPAKIEVPSEQSLRIE